MLRDNGEKGGCPSLELPNLCNFRISELVILKLWDELFKILNNEIFENLNFKIINWNNEMGYSKFGTAEFSRFSNFRIVNIKIIRRGFNILNNQIFEIFEFQNCEWK